MTTRAERFWVKADRSGECWPWTATKRLDGYGQFRDGTMRMAHRVAYEIEVGPIPEGMTLDHTCHDPATCAGGFTCPHRSCVNPAHLEPVTMAENTTRGNSVTAAQARQTHCKRGHPFSDENTYRWKNRRLCRICRREFYSKKPTP